MHCSDIDGQRKEDFQHNTHGCIVMCKSMVNANDQLAELEVIARGCDFKNPFTHTLHKWTVEMQDNANIKQTNPTMNQHKPTPPFTMVLIAKVNTCLRTLAKGQCTVQVCHLGLQQVQPRQSSKKPKGYNNWHCCQNSLVYIQRFHCI